jgi:hypothetical protein
MMTLSDVKDTANNKRLTINPLIVSYYVKLDVLRRAA